MKIQSEAIKDIKKLEDFCKFFGISEPQLAYLRKNKNKLIKVYWLPKRNGDYRTVYTTGDDGYRNFLKAITEMLNSEYLHGILPPPKSVHGFVKGKSIITNAGAHLQKKILLNLDIKNFFDSIKAEQVNKVFNDIGFTKKHASILTELVTAQGVLATGFSTSPVLANIICRLMDAVFEKYCEKCGAVYTRYADDISISSDRSIPTKENIAKILDTNGFKINEDKYKISRRGGSQYVTGLTVSGERPRLPRRLKRLIRLELYYIKKYGFMNHFIHRSEKHFPSKFTRTLMEGYSAHGYISYVHSIEPKLAKKMWIEAKVSGKLSE